MSKMFFDGKDLGVDDDKIEVEIKDDTSVNESDPIQEGMSKVFNEYILAVIDGFKEEKSKYMNLNFKIREKLARKKKHYRLKLTRRELISLELCTRYSCACLDEDIARLKNM